MHIAPIQKNLYTVHTQAYKGSNPCHRSQLGHAAPTAFLERGIGLEGVGADISSTGNLWQVECMSPSETERPLPILDPSGERTRDKVCRKSTSVTQEGYQAGAVLAKRLMRLRGRERHS